MAWGEIFLNLLILIDIHSNRQSLQAHCQSPTVSILIDHIESFKSLFRGRQDIYAIRWEKDGKAGYMPAYKVDWSE